MERLTEFKGSNRAGVTKAQKNAMKTKQINGRSFSYISAYKVGKSQYKGEFVIQFEVLIDGERKVFMEQAGKGVKDGKAKLEWHLKNILK